MLATVDDLKAVELRPFSDARGFLVPIELPQVVPFKIVRFFWISNVPPGGSRGSHAHKACHQFMICASGSVRVEAFDGDRQRSIALPTGHALHVPPAILTVEYFHSAETVLMVFCDRPYEVDDYLDDLPTLIAHRQKLLNERS